VHIAHPPYVSQLASPVFRVRVRARRTDLRVGRLQVRKVLVRERLLAAAAPVGVEREQALQQVHRGLACAPARLLCRRCARGPELQR